MPTFKSLVSRSPITQIAMPLVAERDADLVVGGTAVFVGPRLAVTAMHVIDEFRSRLDGHAGVGDHETSFGITAMMMFDDGKTGMLWSVRKVFGHAASDIALLALEPSSPVPSGQTLGSPRVDLLPPRVGERISAFGYARTAARWSGGAVEFEHDPCTAIGEVTEVHEERRDARMLPFPCFAVNARFDGGMSGGPVFNDDGYLCGIVCSSIASNAPDEDHTSYVSSLWPLLGMPVAVPLDAHAPADDTYPARSLFEKNLIVGRGWEHFGIVAADEPDRWKLTAPRHLLSGRATGGG